MRIAARLSLSTVFIVLLLSSVFLPLETYLSFQATLRRSRQQVEQIRASHIPALVSSLWLTHYDLLEQQIDAIARFPYIARVVVEDIDGAQFVSGGLPPDRAETVRQDLVHSRRGRQATVGELTLYIDQQLVQRDAWQAEAPSLVYHFALAVLLSLTISIMFHRNVGRHLSTISEHLRRTTPDGSFRPLILGPRGDEHDEIDHLVRSINDLQERVARHLEEKDLLIREVHHRIKNNMSSVASLLTIQESNLDHPEAATAIRIAANRVRSMAQLYEKLYQNHGHTSADEYLDPLVEEIVRVTSEGQSVGVDKHVAPLVLDPQTLSALGMIVNELVTNSIKYAFPEESKGTISVRLARSGRSSARLQYRDDGVGFADDEESPDGRGFGLVLIRALAEQLRGSIEVQRRGGTQVTLEFPLSDDDSTMGRPARSAPRAPGGGPPEQSGQ